MRTTIVFALLTLAACNGNSFGPDPTTGSQEAASISAQTLIFKSGHDGNIRMPAFLIEDAHGPHLPGEDVPPFEPGTICLAVWGEAINAERVAGTIRWNPAQLEYVDWVKGRKMEEFAKGFVDWIVYGGKGKFSFEITRSEGLEYREAVGDGPIVYFRLRPVDGVRSLTARLIWESGFMSPHGRVDYGDCFNSPGYPYCIALYAGEIVIGP